MAVIVAVEIDPLHGAIGKLDLACSVTCQRDARDKGMFQALADRGVGAMEIATREGFFEWSGASEGPVKFDAGARRSAGDFEGLGRRGGNEAKN